MDLLSVIRIALLQMLHIYQKKYNITNMCKIRKNRLKLYKNYFNRLNAYEYISRYKRNCLEIVVCL